MPPPLLFAGRFLAWRPDSASRDTATSYQLASAAATAEHHAEQTYDSDDEAGPIAVNVVELCDDGEERELEFHVLVDFEPQFAAELRSRS